MKPRQIIASSTARTNQTGRAKRDAGAERVRDAAERETRQQERNASIVRCRALGLGDATIAHIFATTRQTVHRIAGPVMPPLTAPKPDPPPVSKMLLSDHLRAWRDRHDWTQARAAQELGVSTMTLNRWENERQGCSFAGLIKRFLDLHDAAQRTEKVPARLDMHEKTA